MKWKCKLDDVGPGMRTRPGREICSLQFAPAVVALLNCCVSLTKEIVRRLTRLYPLIIYAFFLLDVNRSDVVHHINSLF
jgi:hypothetical protein